MQLSIIAMVHLIKSKPMMQRQKKGRVQLTASYVGIVHLERLTFSAGEEGRRRADRDGGHNIFANQKGLKVAIAKSCKRYRHNPSKEHINATSS